MNWRQWDCFSPAMMPPTSTDRQSPSTAASPHRCRMRGNRFRVSPPREVVILRESGVSSNHRRMLIAGGSGILDRPPSRAMTMVLLRPRLLRVFPGGLRQRHRALGGFHGLRAGRGAVADTSGDALRNSGEPEQI